MQAVVPTPGGDHSGGKTAQSDDALFSLTSDNITASSARLNALSTTVYLQYGTTTSYGSRTPNQIKTGNNYLNVLAGISGLAAQTTYHFRVVASNTGGIRYGADRTLRTQ